MTTSITNAGLGAVVQSAANILTALQATPNPSLAGFQISVANFKLGAANTPYDPTATDVPGGIVYTGVAGQLKALTTSDPDTIIYVVQLDDSIGNFNYGSVGLYLATGELLTYMSLSEIRAKTQSNLPSVLGNTHVYYLPVNIALSTAIFDLTLPSIDPQTLPFVSTETSLPVPSSTPFNAYIIQHYSGNGGNAALAYTDGLTWNYMYPGAGGGSSSGSGNTILGGSGAPSGTLGNIGDYYIDETNLIFYPAKNALGWPAGISIKGTNGINASFIAVDVTMGPIGSAATSSITGVAPAQTLNIQIPQSPAGPPGIGMPTGGTTKQVIAKNSNADYDYAWQDQPAQAYDLAGSVNGMPLDNEEVYKFVAPRPFQLPAGFAGAQGTCTSTSTGVAVFTVYQNTTVIGTMTFDPTVNTAVFATVANAIPSINTGDVISILAPHPQDATLADIAFTFETYGTVIYNQTAIQGPQGLRGLVGPQGIQGLQGIPGTGGGYTSPPNIPVNVTSERMYASTYFNDTNDHILAIITGATDFSALTAAISANPDMSASITVAENSNSDISGVQNSIMFLIPPGYYYSATSSGGTLTSWYESRFTSSYMLQPNNVIATRALSTQYHNPNSFPVLVEVCANESTGGTQTAYVNSTAPATAGVPVSVNSSAGGVTQSFIIVPPGSYYEIVGTGTLTIWNETNLFGNTVSTLANYTASRTVGTVYQNNTNGLLFVWYGFSNNADMQFLISHDGTFSDNVILTRADMPDTEVNTIIGMVPPGYYYKIVNALVTTPTTSAWWETTLSSGSQSTISTTESTPVLLIPVNETPYRAYNTVYQNNTSNHIIATVTGATYMSPLTGSISIHSDMSDSTIVAENSTGDSNNTLNNIYFIIPPGYYYEVTSAGGGTLTSWYETPVYSSTTMLPQNVLSSRATSTTYHNTNSSPLLVQVGVAKSTEGTVIGYVSATSPVAISGLTINSASSGAVAPACFIVPPGYYYEVTVDTGEPASLWVETNLAGLISSEYGQSSSYSVGPTYQNTSTGLMFVWHGFAQTSLVEFLISSDGTFSDDIILAQSSIHDTPIGSCIIGMVPPGYYFKLAGSPPVNYAWFTQILTEVSSSGSTGATGPAGPQGPAGVSGIVGSLYKPPSLTDFTIFDNSGGGTASNMPEGLILSVPGNPTGGLYMDIDAAYPATPFTYIIGIDFSTWASAVNSAAGLYIRDASGKIIELGSAVISAVGGNDAAFLVDYLNSPTSWHSTVLYTGINGTRMFYSVQDDGTNLTISIGPTINTQQVVSSLSRTAFLSAPSVLGIFVNPSDSLTNCDANFFHLDYTNTPSTIPVGVGVFSIAQMALHAPTSITNGVSTTLAYDTLVFDQTNSAIDVTAHPTTVVVPAGYTKARCVMTGTWLPNDVGARWAIIYHNTTIVGLHNAVAQAESGYTCATPWMTVTAGDTFSTEVGQTSGGALVTGSVGVGYEIDTTFTVEFAP